jgi:hypothetical protein
MLCKKMVTLLERFSAAAECQADAASMLATVSYGPSEFRDAFLVARKRRVETVRTRAALEQHTQEHGCAFTTGALGQRMPSP